VSHWLSLIDEQRAFLELGSSLSKKQKVFFMNIYIGNLSFRTTENKLKTLFAEFGEIESVKVIKDRYSGRPRGFGFIEMPSNSEADKAIKALNGNRVDGNFIKVRPADSGAKKRKKRTFRRRSY
jgi:RNA recognition motif-containing protein